MRLLFWLAISLMLTVAVSGVALWNVPLTLSSGGGSVDVGANTVVHDGYVSISAGLGGGVLLIIGLVLLLISKLQKDGVELRDATDRSHHPDYW
jgi:hypothetical protein